MAAKLSKVLRPRREIKESATNLSWPKSPGSRKEKQRLKRLGSSNKVLTLEKCPLDKSPLSVILFNSEKNLINIRTCKLTRCTNSFTLTIYRDAKNYFFSFEFSKSISVKNYSGKIIKVLFVISLVQGCGSGLLTVKLDPKTPKDLCYGSATSTDHF